MPEDIQFKIKLPAEVKRWIELQAAQNIRSQSGEIILAIRERMQREALHGPADLRSNTTTKLSISRNVPDPSRQFGSDPKEKG